MLVVCTTPGSIYIISFCRSIEALMSGRSLSVTLRRCVPGMQWDIHSVFRARSLVPICARKGLIQFAGILLFFDFWFFTVVKLCKFAIIMQSTLSGDTFWEEKWLVFWMGCIRWNYVNRNLVKWMEWSMCVRFLILFGTYVYMHQKLGTNNERCDLPQTVQTPSKPLGGAINYAKKCVLVRRKHVARLIHSSTS